MKPYSHHDSVADQGKAEPKPKRPTQTSRKYRKRTLGYRRNYDIALAYAEGKTNVRCCIRGHEPKPESFWSF